jgi:D-arabinose 5-phosphate isomerase GutQ
MGFDVIQTDVAYLKDALDALEDELTTQPEFFRLIDDITSRREPKVKLIIPSDLKIDNHEILIRRREYFSKELEEQPSDYIEANSLGEAMYVDGIDRYEIILEMPSTIHLYGAGMSGGVAKNLGQRLHHMGFHVSITGDRFASTVKPGDLCIYFSGSWTTFSTTEYAKLSKKAGATVVGITSYVDRALATEEDCDYALAISGREAINDEIRNYYSENLRGKTTTSIDIMGTLYEFKSDALRLILVHYVSDSLKETEEMMRKRHVQFE